MFAVFSVVSSISGSVKYSDATHLPFSDPERKQTSKRTQKREKGCFLSALMRRRWSWEGHVCKISHRWFHHSAPVCSLAWLFAPACTHPSSTPVKVCLPTSHEANSPEARVQRHLHLHALVLLQDDALDHDQPVVCGHGHAHQQQPAGPEHRGQDGQCTAAARTHLEGKIKGVRQEEAVCRFGKRSSLMGNHGDRWAHMQPTAGCLPALACYCKDVLVTHPAASNNGRRQSYFHQTSEWKLHQKDIKKPSPYAASLRNFPSFSKEWLVWE